MIHLKIRLQSFHIALPVLSVAVGYLWPVKPWTMCRSLFRLSRLAIKFYRIASGITITTLVR